MNWIIYKMEMKRNLKSFLIWGGSVSAVLFLGMLFYPAISANGLILQMEELFENPMMKGMLSAFGADISSFGNLMGFYITYNSIYNVLLACIFASILAGNLLAKEEADRTAEFLFTRPISRRTLFISKSAVLITYTLLLSLLYFTTSICAMEMVKKDAPYLLTMSKQEKKIIIQQINKHPEKIYEAFNLTELSFQEYSLKYASNLLSGNSSTIEDNNLDPEAMNALLNQAMEGPENFFNSVLDSPEEYMSLFSFPPEKKEEFLEHVRDEKIQYEKMKKEFYSSPDLFIMFFNDDPSMALKQFLHDPETFKKTITLLELPYGMEKNIYGKYNLWALLILCSYIFLLLLFMGSLVLCISLYIKRGRSILGAALGIVFFFYFLNSITNSASIVSSFASKLTYISPFSWMDTNYSEPDYGFTWWRILLFITFSLFSYILAYGRFKRKDILI